MKRPLKFRVWNTQTSRMFYATEQIDWSIGIQGEVFYNCGNSIKNNVIVQQYTNTNDKNNTEIYEGDIIEFMDLNYEIYWDQYRWNATCPNYSKYHCPTFHDNFLINCRCGIVKGNSLENPELLIKTRN